MAIANARTGYHVGSTSGWAARSLFAVGGNLYAIVLDTASSPTKVRCYKSTDDGATWAEQDSAHAPSHYSATVSYDAAMALSGITDKIYVAYRPTLADNREVAIRRFDTTTGLWETATIGGIAGNRGHPDYNVRIAIRPDGDITLWYLFSSNIQVQYWIWRGASWAGPTAFSGSDPFWPLDAVQTADSDRAVVPYTRSTLQYRVRTMDSADVVGNEIDVDASVSPLFSSVYGYINDAGVHRLAGLVRDSDGTGDVALFLAATNPTISSVANVIPSTTTDMGVMGGVVVAYAGAWHALWSGDGRGTIHMAASDDYATPAFGANSDVVTGLGADPALSAIATVDGVAVLYTDPTGPSVDLIWAVDGPVSAIELTGSVTGASNATATRLQLSHPLTGSSEGSAAGSASALTVSHALSGESAGAAHAAATGLTVGHALTGSVVGTALASGDLLVQGQAQLAGSAIGGSTATAARLSLSQPLTGSAVGSSQADAARLTVAHALAGQSAGSAIASAEQLRVAHLLVGTAMGGATAAGSLTDAILFWGVFTGLVSIDDVWTGLPAIDDVWTGVPAIE